MVELGSAMLSNARQLLSNCIRRKMKVTEEMS